MSLNDILGTALSGLSAAQAGLRTVSGNIANVNTPGYAREVVKQTTSVTGGTVTGVTVGEPTRIASAFLEGAVFTREGDVGSAHVTSSTLDQLQALLGSSDSSSGLSAQFDSIYPSAVAMTGSPVSMQNAAVFVTDVQNSITALQQIDVDARTLRGNVDAQAGTTITRINTLLHQVYELNETIVGQQALGQNGAGASDLRGAALQELSGLAKITVRNQSDGRVSIDTASGLTLLDRKLRQLSYPSSPDGMAQQDHPAIDIRFADDRGGAGASTGQAIAASSVGGTLGGLIDLRDRVLPAFGDRLGVLFGGLARSLNAGSNASTSVPAPATLAGGQTGLVAGDRLGFTGAASFAVTGSDGTLIAHTTVDFGLLGAGSTVQDAVDAINGGLGGASTATFSSGRLTLTATAAARGVVVAQDATTPSDRAGAGFAQFFGLNDLVVSAAGTLTPSGLNNADPTGFATGQTAQIVLRDASGRALSRATLTGAPGQTFGDAVGALNASPLGSFGSFALDAGGRVRFTPLQNASGATLSITADSTDRFGTGRSFTSLSGLTGAATDLGTGAVRPDLAARPLGLPLAQLQSGAAVGSKALGGADTSGALGYVNALAKPLDLDGGNGIAALRDRVTALLADTGGAAADATDTLASATARRSDALNRRDSFSGVNVDEELSQMVVLQNSYSAAARVMTVAGQMYDTLIGMMGR